MGRTSVAFCGAGVSATLHATAATRIGWTTVAVASPTSVSAERLAGPTGAAVVPLSALPAGADVVVVAGPPATHAGHALALLDAGAAVIVATPLCTTLADADQLVEATRRHGGRLLYAEHLVSAPVVQEFVTVARSAGRLRHLEARALQPRPAWGGHLTDDWGGGALFDLGPHPLALVMLAAGRSPISVSATLRPGTDHGLDDHAEVLLEFDDGLSARVIAGWLDTPTPLWDAQASWDEGVVRAELMPNPSWERNGEPQPLRVASGPEALLDDLGYTGQLLAFDHDRREGRVPVSDAGFGRRILEIVMASYRSAGTGRPVDLPLVGDRSRRPLDEWRDAPR